MRFLFKLALTPLLVIFFMVALRQIASAASFSLSPSVQNFTQGCNNEVVVMVNTAGQNSNSADIEISFDPTKIEVLDADSRTAGIQVENGDAYQAYVYNLANNGTGIIKV